MISSSGTHDNGEGSSHSPNAASLDIHSDDFSDSDDPVAARNRDNALLDEDFLSEETGSRFVVSI